MAISEIMKSSALAATVSCALTPTWAAAAKPCSYSDLMPAYQAFAIRTADLPPEQRATAFRKDLAAQLLLQDLDKTGMPGDRWFLMRNQVEGLPDRAGYYLGYLFAKSVGDGVPLPALTRMPLEQVHEQARAFLTALARQ
jgi:hypothetical protein